MSTRSYICIENQDNTYTGIYCHSDGSLSWNGIMLYNFYSQRKNVEELLALGDISCLKEKIYPNPKKEHSFDNRQKNVTVAYSRDRGETGVEAHIISLKNLDEDGYIEYIYIFNKNNIWEYFESGKLKDGLKNLKEELINQKIIKGV